MSYVRLANFIQVIDSSDNVVWTYQNAAPGKTLSYGGRSYAYLSFVYQGAAKNRTGDNMEAGIMLSVNAISQSIAKDIVASRQHVRIYSVTMGQDDTVSRLLTTEEWLAASMTYDYETLEVILSSGIDAVGANAPTQVLTKALVGLLPTTASIQAG